MAPTAWSERVRQERSDGAVDPHSLCGSATSVSIKCLIDFALVSFRALVCLQDIGFLERSVLVGKLKQTPCLPGMRHANRIDPPVATTRACLISSNRNNSFKLFSACIDVEYCDKLVGG